MKTFRLFAALLVVALLTAPAFPQESSEITSLLAKARKGNGIAQYNLGLAYAEGKGVAADPVEAYVWLTLARENGARGRALDTLMGSLDKSSLETAQRRLTDRKTELGVRTPSTVNVLTTTAPAPKVATPAVTPAPVQPPADESLAKVQAERDALRAERTRLIGVSAEHEKAARTATAANQALQDQARAAEAKATELTRTTDIAKGELARAKLALTAAQKTAATPVKPAAADTTALDQKTRELQVALTELEEARAFGRKVEDSLDKVNDDRARVAATAAAELEAARAFGSQVEATLNRVTDEKAALTAQLAKANASLSSRSAAPAYPDLSGRVAELESAYTATSTSLARASAEAARTQQEVATLTKAKEEAQAALAAKPAATAPTYPDLSGKVAALEAALVVAKTAQPAYPDLRPRVTELEARLATSEKSLATKPSAPAYPDLRGSVTELEAKVASLTAASARAQQETAAAAQSSEASLRNVTRELDVTKAALAAKPSAPAYPDLRTRVAELEAAYTTTSTSLARASAEADRAKQETVALAKARDEAQAALAVKAAAPVAPAYPNLSGKVAELESALANATQKAAAADTARTEVAKQFDDYKGATVAAQREHTTLIASVKMLESDKASLRRQAESAGAEAGQLRTQVTTLKEQLAIKPVATAYPDLRGRVTSLEADLVTAKQLLAAKSAAPVYPDLSGKVTELETALRDSTRQLAAASTEADRAQREVAQLTKTMAETPKAAAATYPDYTNLVKDLTAEVTSLRTDRTQLQQSLAAAERQTGELAASTKRVSELEAQVALSAKPIAPAYPDLSGRVSELEAALAAKPTAPSYPDLSGKVAELETAVADSARKLVAADGTQAELRQQLTAAQETTKASGTTDAQLRRERDELTGRVTSLAGEVTQLRDDRERMQKLLADSGRKLRDSTADASRIKELETQATALQASLSTAQAQTSELQTALAAKPSAPTYPDLSGRVAELESALSAKPTGPAYPDLSNRVRELETQVAAAPKSRAPAYPDLSDRVTELEGQLATLSSEAARAKQEVATLTKAKEDARARRPAAPSYPDLSGRVSELESALAESRRDLTTAQTRLAQATSAPATGEAAPVADTSDLEKRLAATEDRLATALRGYALLEKDRDAQQAKSGQASEALTGEKNVLAAQIATLTAQVEQLQSAAADQAASARASAASAQADTARLNESLAALQRSSGQSAGDAASARTLVQQLQGANSVLAQENYQLKTALSRTIGGPAPVAPVAALVSPPAARMHVVVSGDSLSKLSQRYYGTANRWQEIYNANAGKLGPNGILRLGTELRIP